MKYGAVIIETRLVPDLAEIIKGHLKHLPKDWGLTIFHGKENESALKSAFPEAKFNDVLTQWKPHSYCNSTMTSEYIWNEIPYDKVLIFQSDGMLLRSGIEAFLDYDYIGAPWHEGDGGNGGLSLRDKHKTLELLKHKPYESKYGNEDEYYSRYLPEVGGKVAPREICFAFSCESIFKLGTLGYHAIDRYLTKEQCEQIRGQYKLIEGKEYSLYKNGEFMTKATYLKDPNMGFCFIDRSEGAQTVWTNFDYWI